MMKKYLFFRSVCVDSPAGKRFAINAGESISADKIESGNLNACLRMGHCTEQEIEPETAVLSQASKIEQSKETVNPSSDPKKSRGYHRENKHK